jgi:hypothetical protein
MFLRFLAMLLIVRLSLRAAVSVFGPRPASRPAPAALDDLVRDRVCNTFIPRTRALMEVIAGRQEHFCSRACAQRALTESAGRS